MLPKTEIRMSWIYNLMSSTKYTFETSKKFTKDYLNLVEDCKPFEELYKKNIDKILELIERYTGYEWKREYIPIYILKTDKSSFSDPLTLKFREDPEAMLFLLIHELTHNNIPSKMQRSIEREINEQRINLVTRYVASSLKLDISKAPMKHFTDILKHPWDLSKKPLNYYLDK